MWNHRRPSLGSESWRRRNKMAKKRMFFIEEMKEWLTKGLLRSGVAPNTIERAFELWENGKEPTNVWERGCFNVFQQAQDDVDKHYDDDQPLGKGEGDHT